MSRIIYTVIRVCWEFTVTIDKTATLQFHAEKYGSGSEEESTLQPEASVAALQDVTLVYET